ncbi:MULTISPECIES: acyl carrier protein [Actinomadura]|uniref:Acyl carrier protein n=1 Tax=Actinomadura yumaensis TaxID=111807 RepID=A0ABW2CF11_9ACTN|nr:phosphopantetheine-binding protein [Actinomadura sp. J1-007]MWK38147.1 acyl carrier protein [Actinomadura sp. J1-007]
MNDAERESVREFVSRHVNGRKIGDAEDLFASGYVNSLFAVQLVMWIERTFDMPMEGTDLDFANIRSVEAIGAFVDRKRAALAGGGGWTST